MASMHSSLLIRVSTHAISEDELLPPLRSPAPPPNPSTILLSITLKVFHSLLFTPLHPLCMQAHLKLSILPLPRSPFHPSSWGVLHIGTVFSPRIHIVISLFDDQNSPTLKTSQSPCGCSFSLSLSHASFPVIISRST